MAKTVLAVPFTKPVPAWVTWIFRIQFILNKAFLFWLGSTSLVNPASIPELMTTAATIDLIVWGVGRFFGEDKKDYDIDPLPYTPPNNN